MLNHFFVILLLIISAGVVFFKVKSNYSTMNRPFVSAFDVPSIFNHSHNINYSLYNPNFLQRKENKNSSFSSLQYKATEPDSYSTVAANFDDAKFKYTHITERMTIVHTNY
ncbi:hypothetical protein C0389_01910 [bacterium]|nr:hypothetical protein [bacterium]